MHDRTSPCNQTCRAASNAPASEQPSVARAYWRMPCKPGACSTAPRHNNAYAASSKRWLKHKGHGTSPGMFSSWKDAASTASAARQAGRKKERKRAGSMGGEGPGEEGVA